MAEHSAVAIAYDTSWPIYGVTWPISDSQISIRFYSPNVLQFNNTVP